MNQNDPVFLVYRSSRAMRLYRRAFDVVIAALVLVFASPVILAASLAIVLDDGGPILFRQRRVGRFERPFTMYKLRTMSVANCRDSLSPTSATDSRITRAGRLLRRFSIDELPQLVNVIRGDMTLVGPRPEMYFVVAGYERWQHLRHLATPGITCTWQIRHRSEIPLHLPAATRLDIEYLQRASPLFDAMLLFKTISALVSPKGAF